MKTILNLNEICDLQTNATIEIYNQYKSIQYNMHNTRPAIIICPGGSYQYTSDREAEPIALKFLSEGYNVFVLRYSVLPCQYPLQILELASSVAYIRNHAQEFYIDKDDVSICGFSAGGHVCASLGTLWDKDFIKDTIKINSKDCYPNKMILAYPLIDIASFITSDFFIEDVDIIPSRKSYYETSLDKYVSASTPPTFLWHTLEDTTVPINNSFLFATALKDNNIPFEMHIYPTGIHGLSLANKQSAIRQSQINSHVSSWFNLALEWLSLKF